MAWTDSLGVLEARNANLTADALGSYADSLSVSELVLLVVALSDALGGYADSLASILGRLVAQSDALGSYADALAALEAYLVNPTADNLNAFIDFLSVGEIGTLGVALTDTLGGYADTFAAFQGVFANLTDALGGYDDTLGASIGLFIVPSTDALGSYSDSLKGNLGYLVRFDPDDFNSYDDSVDFFSSISFVPILVSLSDDNDNWADTLSGILGYQVHLLDSSAFSDSVNAYAFSTTVLPLYYKVLFIMKT